MHFLHILHLSIFCMLILHILHINTKYAEQNRALLDTLRIHQSNNNRGHIVDNCPVRHPPYWAYTAQGSHACLIVAVCAEEFAAEQSLGHGVYPPAWDI